MVCPTKVENNLLSILFFSEILYGFFNIVFCPVPNKRKNKRISKYERIKSIK